MLGAQQLVGECYQHMFYGCTALSSVTMLATDFIDTSCLNGWLDNAGTNASSPTLYLHPMVYDQNDFNLRESKENYNIPENWVVREGQPYSE